MTIKELIEKLNKIDQELDVKIYTENSTQISVVYVELPVGEMIGNGHKKHVMITDGFCPPDTDNFVYLEL